MVSPEFPMVSPEFPHMEMHVRAIPESHKYISTAAGHHKQAYGSLVVIDPRIEDDGAMAPLKRLTPEIPFPEVERGAHVYATAWPFSEHYYLCSYVPRGRGRLGIYVVDAFGNKELLYRDQSINIIHPIPFRPRKRPPVIPHATAVGLPDGHPDAGRVGRTIPTTGTIACVNVYEGIMPWPKGTDIKRLRVVQLYPKATIKVDQPNIGIARESLARGVLGTVPVEEDGSAHFTVPAGKVIYFQALDEEGRAVQSMMSDTYVHPGEKLTCRGCHASRSGAPPLPTGTLLALRRAPSKLKPGPEGSLPISFPRLVQPVLDKHCVPCHQKSRSKKKRPPDLSGGKRGKHGWSQSFASLAKYAYGCSGKPPGRTPVRTTPGKFGAQASKLYQMLKKGHPSRAARLSSPQASGSFNKSNDNKLKLPPEDMRRIIIWLDCNSNFFGAYHDLDKQFKGELVKPSIE